MRKLYALALAASLLCVGSARADMGPWGGYVLQSATSDTTITFEVGRRPNVIIIAPDAALIHFTLNGSSAFDGQNPQVASGDILSLKLLSGIKSITIDRTLATKVAIYWYQDPR